MDLFEHVIETVSDGRKFRIDFKSRTLKLGNKILIDNGIVNEQYEIKNINNPLTEIENCFEDYLYSRPSERSEKNRRSYFKAKTAEELTDEQLICGGNREVARAKLEMTLLFSILNGFEWKEEFGSWYWRSRRFPELIILKEWVV